VGLLDELASGLKGPMTQGSGQGNLSGSVRGLLTSAETGRGPEGSEEWSWS